MKKWLRISSASSASIVLVDLMATTFAVLFLLWMVTLLRGAEEQEEAIVQRPEPYSASAFLVTSWYLSQQEEDDGHPNAEPLDEFFGEIHIYDDYIRFGLGEESSQLVTEDRGEFEKETSSFRSFLTQVAPELSNQRIHLWLYENGNLYLVLNSLRKYKIKYYLSYGITEEDESDNEESEEDESEEDRNDEILSSQIPNIDLEQIRPLAQSSETVTAYYLQRYLESRENDAFWRWLTEKVYREHGFDIEYDTHSETIIFNKEDLQKYVYNNEWFPRYDLPKSLFLFITLFLMSLYLLREFRVLEGVNHL